MKVLSGSQPLRTRHNNPGALSRGFAWRGLVPAVCLTLLLALPAGAQNKINTIAGGGPVNNSPLFADIPGPTATALDANGNLYVTAPLSQMVFRKNAGNVLSQFAGTGFIAFYSKTAQATTQGLWNPSGLAVDSQGNVYIADTGNNAIRKVDTTGMLSTVVGTSKPCYQERCGDGHPAASAKLNGPQGVAFDSDGNMYIADTGDNRVRVVKAATGNIEPFAGNFNVAACASPTQPCGDGGSSKLANLNGPTAVAVDSKGNVYIADSGDNRVRMVVPKGKIISAFAGSGNTCNPSTGNCGDGGSAVLANMGPPRGLAVDHSGNVYIADTRDNRIRVVNSGNIATFAGTGARGFSGDGASAANAMLAGPVGVMVDSAGNLYISDSGNQRIREVTGGNINTIIGGGTGGDGGAPKSAQLADPYEVALDSAGTLYVTDAANNRVRAINGSTITTVAGNGNANYSGDFGPAASATLNGPEGVALDGAGTMYIADTLNRVVRQVMQGVITTFAGTGHPCTPSTGQCGDGGPAVNAWLTNPVTVATDSNGNVFIADPSTHRVREVSSGIITTIAGTGQAGYTGDGNLATQAQLHGPTGVAVDAFENVYIADAGNNVIRCVLGSAGGCGDSAHKYAVGDIITYAYNGNVNFQGDGGPAIKASRWSPTEVALDSKGNLFVGGGNNELVQRIDAATGIIVSVAGNDTQYYYYGFSGDNGAATKAHIDNAGLVIDGNENLFIADAGNNRIREVAQLVGVDLFTPKSINFGDVAVGSASQPQPVTFQNTGSDDVAIASLTITGDFSQTNDCPTGSATLAPSTSCTITVTFTPTKKGERDGKITVSDSSYKAPHTIKLTGTGQ